MSHWQDKRTCGRGEAVEEKEEIRIRVVERVEHVDQTLGEVINIKHLFNIWRV